MQIGFSSVTVHMCFIAFHRRISSGDALSQLERLRGREIVCKQKLTVSYRAE